MPSTVPAREPACLMSGGARCPDTRHGKRLHITRRFPPSLTTFAPVKHGAYSCRDGRHGGEIELCLARRCLGWRRAGNL